MYKGKKIFYRMDYRKSTALFHEKVVEELEKLNKEKKKILLKDKITS